ncbi:MAG: hypothetical protein IPM22_17745 [Betaproteobacteria bacterium]|nr:hypothetical protein [Betaproteobacteria bacterium]
MDLSPAGLEAALLDDADIEWRIIVVSACYSGGFPRSAAGRVHADRDHARADRESFGCGATHAGGAYSAAPSSATDAGKGESIDAAFARAQAAVAGRERSRGDTGGRAWDVSRRRRWRRRSKTLRKRGASGATRTASLARSAAEPEAGVRMRPHRMRPVIPIRAATREPAVHRRWPSEGDSRGC